MSANVQKDTNWRSNVNNTVQFCFDSSTVNEKYSGDVSKSWHWQSNVK